MNEIASKARRKGRVRSLAERIGKLTAAVVALGALVNAGVDVLARIRNVPTNKFEQSNEVLYKQHYQETPVVSQPYDVRVGVDVTVRMLVQLYSNGDVFVQYGDWQQWIPVRQPRFASISPIADAVAQSGLPAPPPSLATQLQAKAVVVDLPKLKAELLAVRPPQEASIEKRYQFGELKDDHPEIFSSSGQRYSKTFQAESGYRISTYVVQYWNKNNFKEEGFALSPDGKVLTLTFSLRSGPYFDRYRAWVNGEVKTTQARLD